LAKRIFDLTAALIGLIVLAPLFLLIALLIKLDSPGAVFHRGLRVGKDGFKFRIYKFRTMVTDAAQRGPGITSSEDARITRMGHRLRRTKLDELPQLINVVKGEMSLVGPRPEDPMYVAYYKAEQRSVLSVIPGITSPASLYYRHEEALLRGAEWEKVYVDTILPRKLKIEMDYIRQRSLWSDLKLILHTVLEMFR
jgi:lipopolysaccharide/colanic/teichoic acid biosynthesis glycosyltransferase